MSLFIILFLFIFFWLCLCKISVAKTNEDSSFYCLWLIDTYFTVHLKLRKILWVFIIFSFINAQNLIFLRYLIIIILVCFALFRNPLWPIGDNLLDASNHKKNIFYCLDDYITNHVTDNGDAVTRLKKCCRKLQYWSLHSSQILKIIFLYLVNYSMYWVSEEHLTKFIKKSEMELDSKILNEIKRSSLTFRIWNAKDIICWKIHSL